ncbi:MAG: translation initiation factor IF-2, partial [Candidatus Symbiothrix sp.]|nr:translation initiation factor IF-2 [Candidatus Symbiothrix sp.]
MSIRLNKVTRNLNVGLTTVVDFLQKKGFPTEANPNVRIDDEAYELLVKEFNKDLNLKLESEKFSQGRHQKEKKETVAVEGYDKPKRVEEIKTEIPEEIKPKFVTIGKIDLASLDKKKTKPIPAPVPVPAPVPETVPAPSPVPVPETKETK